MDSSFQKIYKEIEFSLKYKFFDNALLLSYELISGYGNQKSVYILAKTYHESGNPKQAVVLIRHYYQYLLESIELRYLFARVLFDCGEYSESESVIMSVFDLIHHPMDAEIGIASKYLLAMIKMRTHRNTLAGDDFRDVIHENNYFISALYNIRKSDIMYDIPFKNDDLVTYELLINNKPVMDPNHESINSIMFSYLRAKHFFDKSLFDESRNMFQFLYQKYPYVVLGTDYYSSCLWQLKDKNGLMVLSKKLIDLCPNCPETWIVMGNYLSLQQNSEEAIRMFERASSIDHSYSYGFTLAGHEYLSLEVLDKAQTLFRKAIDRCPSDYSAWYGLGSALFRQDKFMASRYYIKKASLLNPNSSVLLFVSAMAHYSCQDIPETLRLLDLSIQCEPKNLVAIFKKGTILFELGKIDEAHQCFLKLSDYAPKEPNVSLKIGEIMIKQKNIEKAIGFFVDALIYGHPEKSKLSNEIMKLMDPTLEKLIKQQ